MHWNLAPLTLLFFALFISQSTADHLSPLQVLQNRYYHCAPQELIDAPVFLVKETETGVVRPSKAGELRPADKSQSEKGREILGLSEWSSAPKPKSSGKLPAAPGTPTPLEPVDLAVVDAEGRAVLGLDDVGDVVFRFDPAPVPGSTPVSLSEVLSAPAPVGDTDRYQICVDQEDGAFCDHPGVVKNQHYASFVLYEIPCTGDFELTPINGRLQLRPSPPNTVLDLTWKVRACNAGGCSAWSDPRKLIWLPHTTLTSPPSGQVWESWNDQVVLAAERIQGAENCRTSGLEHPFERGVDSYVFCIASTPGSCSARANAVPRDGEPYPWRPPLDVGAGNHTGFNVNSSPFIVDVDRASAVGVECEDWHPAVRLGREINFAWQLHEPGQTAWYVGETVYWSVAGCTDLPNGEKGCRYSEWRQMTMPD